VVANFDVPGLGFGVEYRLDSSITTLDRLIPLTAQYAVAAARAYDRDLRSRLYRTRHGFLGLEGLIPPVVGDNVIGGIDEAIYPGWQSKAATNTLGVRETLNTLDAVCSTAAGEPDLTVLGTAAFRDLVLSTQVQQRFWTISGDTALFLVNGGDVYHDSQCGPEAGYVVTTADFGFHASAPQIATEVTPDGRIRIRIRRDEQLFASRRYRSGAVVLPVVP